MIVKEYNKWYIECDCCGCYIPGFVRFDDAVEYAENDNWLAIKENYEWTNICPDCKGERLW